MNIIVTGASRGIGYELVKLLSADQNHTVIAIARNEQQLAKLKAECMLVTNNAKVFCITCDLSNSAEVLHLVSEIKKHISTINILINNAGAIVNKPFQEITHTDLETVFNVNVFSVIHMIQSILPIIDTSKKAHIVNIGSMGGFQGTAKFKGLSAYSASKAALACITECLAEEFKNSTISFNCLALGAAQTEMLSFAFPRYSAPLSANQMAKYIVDFSLNAHNYINGKIIPVALTTP